MKLVPIHGGKVAEAITNDPEGLSRGTIYRLIDAGHLQRVCIGTRAFVTSDSIDRYLDSLAAGASAVAR